VLTDTDNTGGSVEAWYGDIRLRPAERSRERSLAPSRDTRRRSPRRSSPPARNSRAPPA
jgi:hypothetical protein